MIRIGSDKGPTRLLKRSIRHLILIEVAEEEDTTEEIENITNDETIENTDSSSELPEDRIELKKIGYLIGVNIARASNPYTTYLLQQKGLQTLMTLTIYETHFSKKFFCSFVVYVVLYLCTKCDLICKNPA